MLYHKVICIYGTPKIIQSDNAQGFNSKLITELLKILEIKKINSSGYAPRTQGCVEKRNGILMGILRRTVQEKKDSWEEHLSSAVLVMNTSPHSKLGISPFQKVFGHKCRMLSDLPSYEPPMLNQDTSEFLSNIAERIEGYEQKVMEIKETQSL